MDDAKLKNQTVSEDVKKDQAAIDAAAAVVKEHPISEAEAKKFAGVGDFSMPTIASPLDDLIGSKKEEKPVASQPTPTQPVSVQPSTDQPKPAGKAETVKGAEKPEPMPIPGVDTKELEKKAKDMLKDLGGAEKKTAGEPPQVKPKRKRSGTATKMALAAVLVVMMGAGGIVGMNLLKMQQSAENRSKAGADIPGWCCDPPTSGPCDSYGMYSCEGVDKDGKKCTASNVCGDTKRCDCCDTDGTMDWTLGEGDDCSAVCKSKGFADVAGGAACPANITECWCEGWSNGCGVNCHFPDGTQGRVNAEATSACSAKIAMCNLDSGAISIVDYNASNACWGLVDECNNPFAEGNCTPGGFSCSSLKKDKDPVAKGDVVTFTCAGSGEGITRYEFQYKKDSGAYQALATSSTNPDKSVGLTVAQAGEYTVQCRACDGNNKCTAWGLAN